MTVERISIELTNQCSKHCFFCYNSSHPAGTTSWTLEEIVSFVKDCAASGTQAVSLGGGEPLEYPYLSPQEIATVAGGQPFQSMSCLVTCHRSPRFCAIAWDKQVAWCSYTRARRPLLELTARGLETALMDLPLVFCGETGGR